MFPGARKLSSHTRKLLSVFIARMGRYSCGIIVVEGTRVVVVAAAGAHLRGSQDLRGPAR